MFNIFGKKKTPPAKQEPQILRSELDHSAKRLMERSEEIKLKLEKIECELKTALERYRLARTPNEKLQAKKKAVEVLKKKKMYTAQLQNLDQVSFNVENVTMQSEITRDNLDIMKTLKQTNDLQRVMMKEMNFESVDDMIDEIQEAKIAHEEFQDAIQKNYDVEVNEDELDQELEQLDYDMRVELNSKELNVPDKKIPTKKEKDEKDLEEFIVK